MQRPPHPLVVAAVVGAAAALAVMGSAMAREPDLSGYIAVLKQLLKKKKSKLKSGQFAASGSVRLDARAGKVPVVSFRQA